MDKQTMDRRELKRLNTILAVELGRNQYGEGIFSWRWSEDCFWPACDLGGKEIRQWSVPIIGTGESVAVDYAVPEHVAQRQFLKSQNFWLVCKWLSPEDLIHGGTRGHGRGYAPDTKPDEATLRALWDKDFPGADFPVRGWRIPTNARLPRGPFDLAIPNESDTRDFIRELRIQTVHSPEMQNLLFSDAARAAQAEIDSRQRDEIGDSFNAFLNITPGKRGGSVSVPSTRFN